MFKSVSRVAKEVKDDCCILHIRDGGQFGFQRFNVRFVLIIQPGFVKSMTTAPLASKAGLRLARLLAPARMMVRDLVSFAPSRFAAVSLARMPSRLAVMEKPLRSETVRERRSSYTDFLSRPKMMAGLVLIVEKRVGTKPLLGGTKPLLGGTKLLLGGTKPLLGGTKPLLGGTKPLLGGTKPLLGGTKPLLLIYICICF
jgi:hypothetical protein